MRIYYAPEIETTLELPVDEARHCVKVLRSRPGDEITIVDGKGNIIRARLTEVTNKHCSVEIINREREEKIWDGYIHLAVAPTKNIDRVEWLAEKATEIGMDRLSFLNCRYSERRVVKTDRIDRIVVSAVKQSLKATKPQVDEMEDFMDFVNRPFDGRKFICHCYDTPKKPLKDVVVRGERSLVLTGPEGDFSEEEVNAAIQAGFEPVSLGRARLRTETASLCAVHILNLANQK